MTKILLVDLDKDYIRATERNSQFKLNHDLFQEAVENLQQDIKYWSEESGIELGLETVNETTVEENSNGHTLSRTRTRVYGIPGSENDLAWIGLSLGSVEPARKLTYGKYRGWQFDWIKY